MVHQSAQAGADTSLSGRTAVGVGGLIASRLITRSIDFATLLVLARLLRPSDFGLVAIAMTLIQIVEAVLELPVNQVLVRMRTPTQAQVDTAFTLSLLRGVLLFALVAVAAFVVAWLYHDPRLTLVALILGVGPMLRGLQSPNMANFARRIDFRRDMVIEIAGKLAGFSAAVAVAGASGGYWALVVNSVATPAVMALVSYGLAPYSPRLTVSEWRRFAHFLGWSSLSQLVNAINWQCDRLILANFVPLRTLGQFSIANDLAYLPEQAIVKPIQRPLMAVFSLVRDDQDRLRRAYAQAVDGLFAVGLPIMVGLSVLAGPAVRFALGARWAAAAPVLTLLSLSLIPPLATAALGPLAVALRRTETFLVRSTAELCIKVPLAVLGAFTFGVQGLVAARAVNSVAVTIISMGLVKKLIGISLGAQVANRWRSLTACAVMGLYLVAARTELTALSGLPLGAGLVGLGLSGLAIYGGVHMLLWMMSGRPSHTIEAMVGERLTVLSRRYLSAGA